jgi:hypothetical protein
MKSVRKAVATGLNATMMRDREKPARSLTLPVLTAHATIDNLITL